MIFLPAGDKRRPISFLPPIEAATLRAGIISLLNSIERANIQTLRNNAFLLNEDAYGNNNIENVSIEESEIINKQKKNRTYFKNRAGIKNDADEKKEYLKDFLRNFKFYETLKKFEKKYIRRKK